MPKNNAYSRPGPKPGSSTGGKTTNKTRPKRQRRPRRARKNARPAHALVGMADSSVLAELGCTITNPFCPGAKGHLLPDRTPGQRLAFQLRGTTGITTNASGSGAAFFTPSVESVGNSLVSVSTAGASAVLPAAGSWGYYNGANTLTGYGSNYRIVSFGALVRTNMAANSAVGTLALLEVNAIAPGSTISYSQLVGSRIDISSLYSGSERAWISSPDGSSSRAFRPLDSAAPNQSGNFTSLMVLVTGAPASTTNVVMVEYVVNVELLVDTNNAVALLLPPAPRPQLKAVTVASEAQALIGSFVEGGVRAADQAVRRAVHQALADARRAPMLLLGE
jgi:hypothetical protein